VAPAAGDMAFYPVLGDALPARLIAANAPRQAGERAASLSGSLYPAQ